MLNLDLVKGPFSVDFLVVGFFSVAVIFLVVFKASHPLRPVARLNTAGNGPGSMDVVVAMPIQRPQFLEIDFPDGPIQEGAVDRRAVPV